MEEKKVIISVGEAKELYLNNPRIPKREFAEKLLLETNLCIIQERTTELQKEAFENAAEALRFNFRHLLAKGIAKKWKDINLADTLFNLLVNNLHSLTQFV